MGRVGDVWCATSLGTNQGTVSPYALRMRQRTSAKPRYIRRLLVFVADCEPKVVGSSPNLRSQFKTGSPLLRDKALTVKECASGPGIGLVTEKFLVQVEGDPVVYVTFAVEVPNGSRYCGTCLFHLPHRNSGPQGYA